MLAHWGSDILRFVVFIPTHQLAICNQRPRPEGDAVKKLLEKEKIQVELYEGCRATVDALMRANVDAPWVLTLGDLYLEIDSGNRTDGGGCYSTM